MLIAQNTNALAPTLKTGQSESYATNDDGDLQKGKGWPKERFADNKDGTISDKLTGLMWLKEADCASEIVSGASTSEWKNALDFANSLNLNSLRDNCTGYTANYTDWRTANINELISLMRAGLINKPIVEWLNIPGNNSPGFNQTSLINYPVWSATTYAADSSKVWVANFDNGGIALANKSSQDFRGFVFSAVRTPDQTSIVKTGQTKSYYPGDDGFWQTGNEIPELRFVDLDNGTVIDKLTGLIWLKTSICGNLSGSDWTNSVLNATLEDSITSFIANCSELTSSSNDMPSDWRLPNLTEILSLIDYGSHSPAIESKNIFDIELDAIYWTSTSANETLDVLADNAAWAIDLINGQIIEANDKVTFAYSWPVAGPVNFADIQTNRTNIDFGSIYINTETRQESITIKNNGSETLEIDTLRLTNSSFSFNQDNCSQSELIANSSCSITLEFSPVEPVNINAELIIFSNALGINNLTLPITGNGLSNEEKSNPNCFIATAAFGSFLQKDVIVLRNFRDQYLIDNFIGTHFVQLYYQYSPPIAKFIEKSDTLKQVVRLMLTPIIYSIKNPANSLLILLLTLTLIWIRQNETFFRILRTK